MCTFFFLEYIIIITHFQTPLFSFVKSMNRCITIPKPSEPKVIWAKIQILCITNKNGYSLLHSDPMASIT